MAGQKFKICKVTGSGTNTQTIKHSELKILHHNVQSLNNKLLDLSISISTEEVTADILCLTEHWLKVDQINNVHIDQFKLISSFCRSTQSGGGSSIFVKPVIKTNEVEYLKGLG